MSFEDIKNAGPIWIRYEIELFADRKTLEDNWGSENISITQGPLLRGTIKIETDEKVYYPTKDENLVDHVIETELTAVRTALQQRYGEDKVIVWVDSGLAGDIKFLKSYDPSDKGQWREPTEGEKERMRRFRNPPQPPREALTIELDERLLPLIDGIRKEKETEFGHLSYVPKRSRGKVIETLCTNAFKLERWLKTQPWELQQRVAGEALRKPLNED